MKRAATSLLWTFGAIVLAVALIVIVRAPVAQTGLKWWLGELGVTNVTFTITRFDTSGIELSDIAAGEAAAIRIARVTVAWSPATLLRGRADGVGIISPRIRGTIAGGSFRIAGLPPLAREPGETETAPDIPVDRIELTDARLDLETGMGPVAITGSATYAAREDRVRARVDAEIRGQPGSLQASVALTGPDITHIDGTIDISNGVLQHRDLAIGMLNGKGRFAVRENGPESAGLSLSATSVSLPRIPGGLRGTFDLDAGWTQNTNALDLRFAETEGGRGLSVTTAVSDIRTDNGAVSANAVVGVALDRYVTGATALNDIAAELPVSIGGDPKRIVVALSREGRLAIRKIATGGAAMLQPVTIALLPSPVPLATIAFDGSGKLQTVAQKMTARIARTKIALAPTNGAARTASIGETRFSYTGRYAPADGMTGRMTLTNSAVALNAPALALERVEADLSLADANGNGTLRIDIGRLADGLPTARFNPLGLAVEIERKNGQSSFIARMRDATQTVRATASGPWPLTGPRDEIFIDIPPVIFTAGGLQPVAFIPGLAAIDLSHGKVAATARIGIDAGVYKTSAQLTIDDVSLAVAGASINQLTASLNFDSLIPPTTLPGQLVTIGRIDLLTPIEDIRIDYRLATDEAGTPRLDIGGAQASLLGGAVSIDETALLLDGRAIELPIQVTRLDIAHLLELLGVDGLEGRGTLSGNLPITLSATVAEIRDGRLTADEPGVLRLDSAAAADYLAAQGPSVDLAVRALEDFHYSELTINIAREAAGEARLALSMLGHNPAVLDAHPFRFNIDLKSNVDELIAALMQGYSIATDRFGHTTGRLPGR